jgi:ABC-type proline/glycine betaine transport system ATPase subunit
MSLLQVEGLSIHFGGVKAVDNISFTVEPGEVFTIVGPNGAGKSTIFNLISRLYEPTAGRIMFDGRDITRLPAHDIAGIGIARTFQNIELFDHSSVLQNLLIGRHSRRRTRWYEDMLFLPKVRRAEREDRRIVEEVIDFLELAAYRDKLIAGLPYGVRKLVDVVGPSFAQEIFFTARQFSAPEALAMGLINRMVPQDELLAYVTHYAATIAANAPLTVASIKTIVGEIVKDASLRNVALCDQLVAQCFNSADFTEGRTAFMEKRKPVFTGR